MKPECCKYRKEYDGVCFHTSGEMMRWRSGLDINSGERVSDSPPHWSACLCDEQDVDRGDLSWTELVRRRMDRMDKAESVR